MTTTIQHCLKTSLAPEVAQALLCHILDCDRAFLYTHPDQQLTDAQSKLWQAASQRRMDGEPVAYIIGYRDFWTLRLNVTPDVLIPRHETELLVETALAQLPAKQTLTVADLGTGSGAIACALASERPNWRIIATDQSPEALAIAQANAQQHNLRNITFEQGSWCDALPVQLLDAIISNPPYIGADEPELQQGDPRFEPQSALIADNQGLADIDTIAEQAQSHLKAGGLLLSEHGFRQGAAVREIFNKHGYTGIETLVDLAGLDRATICRQPAPSAA